MNAINLTDLGVIPILTSCTSLSVLNLRGVRRLTGTVRSLHDHPKADKISPHSITITAII
jgi:hypothetical protein